MKATHIHDSTLATSPVLYLSLSVRYSHTLGLTTANGRVLEALRPGSEVTGATPAG